MRRHKARIVVGTDPFVLRTALQRVLASDPRLEAVLVPASGNPVTLAWGADVVMVSDPIELPDIVVALLKESSSRLEFHRNGERRSLPYSGLEELAESLASAGTLFSTGEVVHEETRGPPDPVARSDPGEGGGPRDAS